MSPGTVSISGGPADDPGAKGQYADVDIHSGPIWINDPVGMTSKVQCELFQAVPDEIAGAGKFVNEVNEVSLEHLEGDLTIWRYNLSDEAHE